MVSIRKRVGKTKTSYELHWRHRGKHRQHNAGNYKQAQALKRKLEYELSKGTYKEIHKASFEEVANQWLEYARLRLKENTYLRYRGSVKKYFVPFFSGVETSKIVRADVLRLLAAFEKQGLNAKTTNNHRKVLKQLFDFAKEANYILENPVEKVSPLAEISKEMKFLTFEQSAKLLDNIEPFYHAFFFTALDTGMRLSEIIHLKWTDVDFKQRRIVVVRKLKTKTSKRGILMSQKHVAILKEHKLKSEGNHVFVNHAGSLISRNNIVKRNFKRTLKKAGLPDVRFHDLRHTWVSNMLALGASIKFIQHQLGHASIRTTLDTYGHLIIEDNIPTVDEYADSLRTR